MKQSNSTELLANSRFEISSNNDPPKPPHRDPKSRFCYIPFRAPTQRWNAEYEVWGLGVGLDVKIMEMGSFIKSCLGAPGAFRPWRLVLVIPIGSSQKTQFRILGTIGNKLND